MSEGTKDAMILISTSWQALGRAIQKNPQIIICDCTVVTLFAGIFIEANLNYIIEKLNMKTEMVTFLNNPYPSLQDKLAWFYNKYIAKVEAKTKKNYSIKGLNPSSEEGIEVLLRSIDLEMT